MSIVSQFLLRNVNCYVACLHFRYFTNQERLVHYAYDFLPKTGTFFFR